MAEAIVTTEELDPPEQIEQTPAAPVSDDADDIALAQAEADLAAEEAAESGAPEAVVETVEETPAAQPVAKAPVMVPKERLDQVLDRSRKLEEDLAYERGRSSALEASRDIKPVAAAPEPTPAERIKALRDEQIANAKAYNEGEIDAVEWETRRTKADDLIADIRAQGVAHAVTAEATDPARSEWLAQQTTALEEGPNAFPILATTKADGSYYFKPSELKALEAVAAEEMADAGRPFNRRDAGSILELRTRTAELAQHNFGYRLPAEGPAPGTAVVPAKAPVKGGVTPAQRSAKIALAGRAPPDITRAGAAASANDLSESRVAGMAPHEMDELTDAEIEAMERKMMAS